MTSPGKLDHIFVCFIVYAFPELDPAGVHNQPVGCSRQTLIPLELWKIPVCPAVGVLLSWTQHVLSPFHDVSLSSVLRFPFSIANHKELVPLLWHPKADMVVGLWASGHPGTRAVSLQCTSGPGTLGSCFESRVVVVCEKMMSRACWRQSPSIWSTPKTFRGMTLLHLAAAQGYATLIRPSSSGGKASVLLTHQRAPLLVCPPVDGGRAIQEYGILKAKESLWGQFYKVLWTSAQERYWARC